MRQHKYLLIILMLVAVNFAGLPWNPQEVNYYTNATSLNYAFSLTTSGNYLYVVSEVSSLTTFNITNPATPVQTAYYTNGTSVNNPYSVTTSGNYLYVVSGTGKSLTTFNITNPAIPVQTAYYTNAASLNGAYSVTTSGNYLYVVSVSGNSLTTFNITNPATPIQTAYYTNATSLNSPRSVTTSGNYLYVASMAGNSLTTFNITNPTTPIQVAYYANATSLNQPYGVNSVTTSGNYLYVASVTGNSLTTFNITNPATPVQTAYYTNGTSLDWPTSVTTSGNYLYVASGEGKSLTTFNITNPATPVQTAYYTNATSLNNPYSVTTSGNYLYVASFYGNSLTTFDISPPPSPSISSISPSSGPTAGGTNITITGANFTSNVDANTKLLLHADGTGASFVDSSQTPKTITVYGGATQSAAQSKFGGKSAYFDGSGDYLTVPSSQDWNFSAGNFTIDWWEYRQSSTANVASILLGDGGPSSTSSWFIGYSDGTNLVAYITSGSGWDIASAKSFGAISMNQWVHLAIVRSGSTFYLFKNGQITSTWTSSLAINEYTSTINNLTIGSSLGGRDFTGSIDELRISKGISRWTSDFTPPASAYGEINVTIGGSEATNVVVAGSTTINATTPAHSAGAVDVVVTNPDGQSGILQNGYYFTPPLAASNFSASYGSTNFSAIPDLNNVTNLTLATPKGKIKFAENHIVNATGQDYDSQVVIGNGFISVNSSALSQTFNTSATLTINNVTCPATVYYASGFFNSSESVIAQKKICNSTTDPSCTNITCSDGNLTFTVSHFTGFAYGTTANLTIWDETDSGMPNGNQNKYISQNIRFFANYSNSSSEPITGADCQIWFTDSGWNSMSWNSTNLYEYTRSFSSGGSSDWNVTCNKSGQATLDANDSVIVNSTIAVVLNSPADNAIVKSSVILYNWSVYGFPGDPTCNLTRNGSVVYSATCTNNALCGYTNSTANGEYIWNVTCNSGATTRTSSTRTLTVNTLYHSTNVEGVLNMNITEISSISLPQNTISFGTVEITQTYDSYPSQFFVIKNDGNTIVDIEVNATNPFLSSNCTSLPCSAYQVKVGANETIPYPICSGNPSKESYTNMFGSSSGLLINNFNFVDNDDSANIYIKFRLPNDEPPGSKSSTVTFWAKSANSYACN